MSKSREQELIQYFVVNHDLGMSPDKVAAQVAHAAVLIALRCVFEEQLHPIPDPTGRGYLRLAGPDGEITDFAAWVNDIFKKVVLRGTQADLEHLERQGFLAIRDAGHTEVTPQSLTVVGLPPMSRQAASAWVGTLKTLRTMT